MDCKVMEKRKVRRDVDGPPECGEVIRVCGGCCHEIAEGCREAGTFYVRCECASKQRRPKQCNDLNVGTCWSDCLPL